MCTSSIVAAEVGFGSARLHTQLEAAIPMPTSRSGHPERHKYAVTPLAKMTAMLASTSLRAER
jgi:hypothetical protein